MPYQPFSKADRLGKVSCSISFLHLDARVFFHMYCIIWFVLLKYIISYKTDYLYIYLLMYVP
jgi:hypothetical protein